LREILLEHYSTSSAQISNGKGKDQCAKSAFLSPLGTRCGFASILDYTL
jgi:hypothetical protein